MPTLASRLSASTLLRRPVVLFAGAASVLALTACSMTDTTDLDPNAGAAGAGGSRGGNGGSSGGSAGKAGNTTTGGSGGAVAGGASGSTTGGSAGALTGGAGGTTAGGAAGTSSGGFGGSVVAGSGGSVQGGAGGSTAAGAAGSGTGTGGAVVTGGSAGATAGGAGGQAPAGSAGSAGTGNGGSGGAQTGAGNGGSSAGGGATAGQGGGGGDAGQGGSGAGAGGSGAGAGGSGAAGQAGSGGSATGQPVLVRTQHYDGAPSPGHRIRINDVEIVSDANGEAAFPNVTLPYTMYYGPGSQNASLIQAVIIRGFTDLTDLAPVIRISQNPNADQRPKVTYIVKATIGGAALTVGQSVCLFQREALNGGSCANVVAGGDASIQISLAQQAQPAIVAARSGLNAQGDLLGAVRLQLSGSDGDTRALPAALEAPTISAFKPSAEVPAGYTVQSATLTAETDDALPPLALSSTGTDATLASINKLDLPWLKQRFQVSINGPEAGTSATFTRNGVDELLGAKATFTGGPPTLTLPAEDSKQSKLGVGGTVTIGGPYTDKILAIRSQGAGGNIQDDPRHRWLIVRTQRSSFTLPALDNFRGKWQAGDPGSVSVTGQAPNTPVSFVNVSAPPVDGVTWQVQRTITLQ